MRTPRIVIIGAFFFATFTLTFVFLRFSHPEPSIATSASESPGGGLQALFSFHAPLSLFPPNAIISLTDDNTTSFLARPAAFGPLLPAKGLSGQLWIGSGFGDDGIRQGTIVAGAEGELGCSDVPGWVDGNKKAGLAATDRKASGVSKASVSEGKAKKQQRGGSGTVPVVDRNSLPGRLQAERVDVVEPSIDDGTDDYLHHPLPGSTVSKPSNPGQDRHDIFSTTPMDHADIQSIQEGAEIAGKIVLLSRGGCGFLEKVKWTQRRGGIALIVGDDTRGGPLIQMYAHGDTSNVTIPSIFTSHTTAHLLSSLIPPGSYIEDTIDENGKAAVKMPQSSKQKKNGGKGQKHGSSPADAAGKPIFTSRPTSKSPSTKTTGPKGDNATPAEPQRAGWFSSLFSKPKTTSDSKPGSSSGKQDWVLVADWDETEDAIKKTSSKPATPKSYQKGPSDQRTSTDDFVIGVQDWRDPDLVEGPASTRADKKAPPAEVGKKESRARGTPGKKKSSDASHDPNRISPGFKGGSITPGSGEYEDGFPAAKGDLRGSKTEGSADKSIDKNKSGLLTKLFGDDDDESDELHLSGGSNPTSSETTSDEQSFDEDEEDPVGHEGLWVTLTPTTGASPFFDTLLVLVVSPLVTLTVVYALLLLRSRIRRRRWRAPKSVVERLPVRTYQTIVSNIQSRLPSPTSSSPTTPLLQQAVARPRPRSRTISSLPEPGLLLRTNSDSSERSMTPSRGREHEKGASVTSEWRRYMGKQVECVVCLEEYIDGVSRVMSLPCGHEFHVDCITPWLTTRRRTCPICKGDVVRSLARDSPSGARYEAYRDDSDDEAQVEAGETANGHHTAAMPIARDARAMDGADLERGTLSPSPSRPQRNNRTGSWRSILALSLGSTSQSPRLTQEDRSR